MTLSSPASRIQSNLKELFRAKLAPGNPYIRFQLTADITALLPMEQVQESLVIEADKITPLPSMPESVIGIMSSRDRVFCVCDLAQLLTLPSQLVFPRHYQIIVVDLSDLIPKENQELYLGLAIKQIQGINRLTSAQINSAIDHFPDALVPYLQGYVTKENQLIPILDFGKIAQVATRL